MPSLADFPLTSKQAAESVGVHHETIKRWAAAGKIRSFRTPGGWWRFAQADLDDFIASQTNDSEVAS